jgi:hypothetical protein
MIRADLFGEARENPAPSEINIKKHNGLSSGGAGKSRSGNELMLSILDRE